MRAGSVEFENKGRSATITPFLFLTGDVKQGAAAFRAKRKPEFK